jgi:hypothetical protein
MIIRIDAQGQVTLHDVANLKAFSMTGPRPDAPARHRLAEAGVDLTDDAGHGFVAASTVSGWAHAAGPVPQGWQADFDAMVAYATSKGWTDDEGRLRAHTEWES